MVQFGEEKMSKSLGNLITIKDALQKYSADAIRIFALGSHYRSPLTYSEEILEAAERGADRLRNTVNAELDDPGIKYKNVFDTDAYRRRFVETMDDDFNTAQALAALFDFARDINRASEAGYSVARAQQVLLELAGVLGLTFQLSWAKPLDDELFAQISASVYKELSRADAPDEKQGAEKLIENLIKLRNELRQAKQWQQADMVRAKLDEAGIALEDTPKGTVWKRKR